MSIRTIIVDDEAPARERLRSMLTDLAEFEIVDEASDGVEAVEKIASLRPDLVLLDIEMPGLNGFKVVQSIGCEQMPKIIFVTAYNQYALEAFEVGAVDYLLKPVKRSRLLESLGRAAAALGDVRHDIVEARRVQNRLLPSRDLRWGRIEAAGECAAVHEVGGDYYDFIELPSRRLGFCIADVSGKGFPAALMMSHLQAALRILAVEISEPKDLVGELNKVFFDNSVSEMFATLFYGVFDDSDKSFVYCCAGHNPPLLFRNGAVRRLSSGGTVVGMFSSAEYEQESFALLDGDFIAAYSDGLIETTGENGEELGEEGLIALMRGCGHLSAVELKNMIMNKIESLEANGQRSDDATAAILKVATSY